MSEPQNSQIEEIVRNDKEPIIIKDYNSLFMFLLQISLIPAMILIYIYNPGGTSEGSLFRNIFIIIPVMMYPYISAYIKSKGKRKIVLENGRIQFMHENIILEEILISEITDIKKTYSDIYHKSQYPSEFGKSAFFIVIPLFAYFIDWKFILIYPAIYGYLMFLKFIFHKLKDKEYTYRFYDAIIIYSGEKFINILPTTNQEFELVRDYFLTKDLGDIQDKKVYFEIGHMYEKIELGE